ncbi:MAG: phosphatase PAP2 family protein, partial [Phycisphaerales bacterium]|nr:phosphatase PAP2 family protein [Phycisphaerales bacterium]
MSHSPDHLGPLAEAPKPSASPRRLAITAAASVLLAVILLPADGPISTWARSLNPGGDLKRELEVLQQFGGATSVIIVLLCMIALDAQRVRRMLDWALAAMCTSLSVLVIKMLAGRPRPKFADPLQFNGPFGQYIDPTKVNADGTSHIVGPAFGFGREELWSMPSSHTSAAFVLAVFLATMYPRLKPMAFGFAILVGVCRVVFGAHYL